MISERIKLLRGKEAIATFAKAMGIHRNTLPRYESGERTPDGDFLARLCSKSGVEPAWLLLGEGPMRKGQEDQSPATAESSPQYSGQLPDDDIGLGESVELLAKIYNSGNNVLVRAIAANLHAFSEAVDNKALAAKTITMMDEMNKRMLAQENELAAMKKELARMKSEEDGKAAATA